MAKDLETEKSFEEIKRDETLANFRVFATLVSPRCPICDGDGYTYELEEAVIDTEYGTRIETRVSRIHCTNCQ
jgi:hypothetical protein